MHILPKIYFTFPPKVSVDIFAIISIIRQQCEKIYKKAEHDRNRKS